MKDLNEEIENILRYEICLDYLGSEEWGIEGWHEATTAITKYIEEHYIAKD